MPKGLNFLFHSYKCCCCCCMFCAAHRVRLPPPPPPFSTLDCTFQWESFERPHWWIVLVSHVGDSSSTSRHSQRRRARRHAIRCRAEPLRGIYLGLLMHMSSIVVKVNNEPVWFLTALFDQLFPICPVQSTRQSVIRLSMTIIITAVSSSFRHSLVLGYFMH